MDSLSPDQTIRFALSHHQAGRLREAEAIYRQILARHPDHADALHLLGVLAHQVGKTDEAVKLIRRAIASNPNEAIFHSNLGKALSALQRHEEAAAEFQRAIDLKPDLLESHNGLVGALRCANRLDETIAACHRALILEPQSPAILYELGIALKLKGYFPAAIEALHKAIAIKPDLAEAYNGLADMLRDSGDLEQAEAALRKAISIKTDFAEAHNNLSTLLLDKGRIDDAIAQALLAKSLKPQDAQTHHNLGQYLLLKGEFGQAWAELEWRVNIKGVRVPMEDDPHPRWDGSPLNGRRILVYAEQGFGDTIQFSRYLPLLANRHGAGAVIFQTPKELTRLLGALPGIQTIPREQPLRDFDVRCPLLSLPMHFKTTLETIPDTGKVPYLLADRQSAEHWRERLKDGGQVKVGLVWAGRAEHKNDRYRSIPFKLFSPLLDDVAGHVQFFSLQKGPAANQLRDVPNDIIDWTTELNDFTDTAALIDNLDLIISVDTAVAHLAGAMGKPTWVLLSSVPDWRWMLDREDSPWYPTIRLFRQPKAGDWQSPIQRVTQALQTFKVN